MSHSPLLAAVLLVPLAVAGCTGNPLASLGVAPAAGGGTGPAGKPLPDPAIQSLATVCAPADPAQVTAMLTAVNAERASLGRSPLVLDERLGRAAQAHSCDMVRMGRTTVAGSNGNSVLDRARAVEYRGCGAAQNIAATGQSPESLARAWAIDRVARDNLVDQKFDDVGIGARPGPGGTWWTLVFGERC